MSFELRLPDQMELRGAAIVAAILNGMHACMHAVKPTKRQRRAKRSRTDEIEI